MTYGSLFSGIGGMDLGLDRAGMTCKWQVEIDPFCRQVLTKHWPNVPKFGDIRELTGEELEPVDLIAGGFPCQDVSVAGLRAGIDGERSGLWREYYRLICALRPRFVLVENVPGLLTGGIGRVLGNLAEVGFDAEWTVLPASDFGAPHRRERVFLLAHPAGSGWQGVLQDHRKASTQAPSGWPSTPLHSRADAIAWVERVSTDVPVLLGVDYGVPNIVDRLRGCGNAVVPQVAQWIGERIMECCK